MAGKFPLRVAAFFGFTGVALGAFGAHLWHTRLIALDTVSIWQTAVLYHLVHTVTLLALGIQERVASVPVALFSTGILIFSGSLYLLAATNARWLGAITPLGGLCFLAGWAWLFVKSGAK